MKGRAYRRWKEEVVVRRRLRRCSGIRFWGYDEFGYRIYSKIWIDLIGGYENFKYKTYTTDWRDTRFKYKYSPNSGTQWREIRNKKSKTTREFERKKFLEILKENGLEHIPFSINDIYNNERIYL